MSNELTTINTTATALILNESAMISMDKLAQAMAASKVTVPAHLQGKPSDCLAVVMQAAQWGMNPFAVAQKTHLVSGNLGYEAQLVNAVISSSRAITGRFKYQFDNWKNGNGFVRVGAVLAGEDEITWGEWLDTNQVKTKNSPLWKTAPKQQAAYLAVKYWARLYCPEVIMGVYSADELESVPTELRERDITPQAESSTLNAILQGEVQQKPGAVKQINPEDYPEPVKQSQGPNDEELQNAANYALAQFDKHAEARDVTALDNEYEQAAGFLSGSPYMVNIQAGYEEAKAKIAAAQSK